METCRWNGSRTSGATEGRRGGGGEDDDGEEDEDGGMIARQHLVFLDCFRLSGGAALYHVSKSLYLSLLVVIK